MKTEVTPFSFQPSGPDGFLNKAPVSLPTAKLIEGEPKGLDHAYFERASSRLKAGIWRSSPYTEWYDDYPCDEFMLVLEGHVIVENDHFSQRYNAGDAFLIPRGFRGYWRQPVGMLKYYCIVE